MLSLRNGLSSSAILAVWQIRLDALDHFSLRQPKESLLSDDRVAQELDELRKLVHEQTYHILRAQDREIGLENELTTARAGANREPLLIELATIKSSVSYRLGRTLTWPLRVLAHAFAFGSRGFRAIARRIAASLRARISSER